MSLLKKSKRNREMIDANVNITALMDILTVLLFFLIKSFTITSTQLTPPKGMRLPAADTKSQLEESISVAVTTKDIRFNAIVISNLTSGKISERKIKGEDLDPNKRTIAPLRKLLEVEYKKKMQTYKGSGISVPETMVLIQADRRLRFSLMKHVLWTISSAGYTNYQFVVTDKK